MYYPVGFDRKKAVQIAGLLNQAYDQFEAFKRNKQWTLLGEYTLIVELRYQRAQPASTKGIASEFDRETRVYAGSKDESSKGVPIGFIARRKKDTYLVFRGTMTTAEWFRDLSIRLTPYPYRPFGKVHDGFIQTYDNFRGAIHDTLRNVSSRARLFVAGHSLGAAVATLAVPDIAAITPFSTPHVYTYGSPRVGDKTFAAEYNRSYGERSFRIANTCDMVASIPFPTPFLGFLGGFFTHVETPIDFTSQEEDSEKNHSIETYLAALEAGSETKGLFRLLFRKAPDRPWSRGRRRGLTRSDSEEAGKGC